MKINQYIILLLCFTIVNASQQVFTPCKLQIFVSDPDQWHDLIEGLVYGFMNDPDPNVDECQMCNALGWATAGAQHGIVDLEITRE